MNHELTSAKAVTIATAPLGVDGHVAASRMRRPIGADVASTWPVMITSDICSVNGISSQKPEPQASITCTRLDGVKVTPATTTMSVPINAKMNASGT